MDASILIAAGALGLSAIGFFYNLGRDTKGKAEEEPDDDKLDQIYKTTEAINKKLDEIAKWQMEAASIHSSHSEQIKTLFNRVNDQTIIMKALEKILERMS